jgi:hypothetical protein
MPHITPELDVASLADNLRIGGNAAFNSLAALLADGKDVPLEPSLTICRAAGRSLADLVEAVEAVEAARNGDCRHGGHVPHLAADHC